MYDVVARDSVINFMNSTLKIRTLKTTSNLVYY